MKRDAILNLIKDLSRSQGFYGRLYESIMDLEEDAFEELMEELESKNFKDALDFILWVEC